LGRAFGVAVGLLIIGLEVSWLVRWNRIRRRAAYRAQQAALRGQRAAARRSTSRWLWLALLLGILIIFSAKNGDALIERLGLVMVSMGVGLLFVVCAIVIPAFKYHDRGVNRAVLQANAGDVDGGILELRRQIEEKGPSAARSNALGCLFVTAKRWDEANRMFDEAEQLGMDRTLIQGNRGLVFLETGDPDSALPLLEEAARAGPRVIHQMVIRCNLCRALAELGRVEEARTQLRLAEESRKRTLVLSANDRRVLSETIQKCRDQLAALKPTDLRAVDEF
jgi:hypothetical protein